MALSSTLRAKLTLPVFCAPMFSVTGPALVREACKAGIIGGLPRKNAGDIAQFDDWLRSIRFDLDGFAKSHPEARVAPVAVNLSTRMDAVELETNLDVCERHGVEIIVSAAGNPAELIRRVHSRGLQVFHDVTSVRFADKAIAAGADGLICIGAGGGGHSGTISHLALIPRIRAMFDGVVVMAGAVSTGAAVRAAEILGADLAYMGTRFIATQESEASPAYKQMLIDESSADLMYTPRIAGVAANWLVKSIRENGMDPLDLPQPAGKGMHYEHLPEGVRPWKSLWSAGQGIDLIADVPTVAELACRLRREYIEACARPDMVDAARLAEDALRGSPPHT